MKLAVVLALVGLAAIASAQFTPQPGPVDFPSETQQSRSAPNWPQDAGNQAGNANPFTNQFTLPNPPDLQLPYGTGYGGGLTGRWPGQRFETIDPVRGVVLEAYNSKGASSQGPTGRSGRGAASGTGFQNTEIKDYRDSLSSKEFIAPMRHINPPKNRITSDSLQLVPSVLVFALALLGLVLLQ